MSQQLVLCARCHRGIAPDDQRTVYQRTDYHQRCFLILVREEAEQQRMAQRDARLPKLPDRFPQLGKNPV